LRKLLNFTKKTTLTLSDMELCGDFSEKVGFFPAINSAIKPKNLSINI